MKKPPLIDLHNHTLWEIDDGLETIDDSINQIQKASESGIHLLYVTPHIQPGGKYFPSHQEIIMKTKQLNEIANVQNIEIDIKYGCEFLVNQQSLSTITENHYLCYENTDWVLIEQLLSLSDVYFINEAIDLFSNLDKKVLIAHVERYFEDVQSAVRICSSWKKKGAFLQINRTSILNLEGKLRLKIAKALIDNNLCHIIATDAHRTYGNRILRLDDSYEWVVKKYSHQTADILHSINPQKLSRNELLIDTNNNSKYLF